MKGAKTLVIAGTVASIGLATLAGGGLVSAATNGSNENIVDKIASKFNLKKSDVQAVFDQDKAAHQAERTAENSARLQTLVDDGKITAEQKTLIEAKQAENQKQRETERVALEKWAIDNKIDFRYLMGRGMMRSSDNRLEKAVSSGKITAEQKTLIEAKQADLQKQHDANRAAMEKWATDNKIDIDSIRPSDEGMRMGGRGEGMGMRQD